MLTVMLTFISMNLSLNDIPSSHLPRLLPIALVFSRFMIFFYRINISFYRSHHRIYYT